MTSWRMSITSPSIPRTPMNTNKLRERIEVLARRNNDLPDKIIYYLATPPVMYEIVPQCLLESGLNKTESPDGFRRIIVEKPFGTSLESARQLNDHLRHIFH